MKILERETVVNVIFVTVSNINNLKIKGFSPDLMNKNRNEEHQFNIVSLRKGR